MSVDQGLELGINFDAHFARLEKVMTARSRERKPVNRTVMGTATTPASAVPSPFQVQTNEFPAHGRMWVVRSLSLLGSDDHTTVTNGALGSGSTSNAGTVTNPGATTTIVSDGVLSPGTYDVSWQVSLQGTVTAADANNMRLVSNGVNIATAIYPGVVGNYPQPTIRITVPAGATATLVQSIAASSGASAIYGASITATPVAGLNQGLTPCVIYAGPAMEIAAPDFTSIAANNNSIPFFKDYGYRHITVMYSEQIYANIYNAPVNQPFALVAVVDEYVCEEVEASRI